MKLTNKLQFGICMNQFKIYNNFIYMLYVVIEENNNIIKKYDNKIKKNTDEYFKNYIKLNTWNYLNKKYQTIFKKRQTSNENIINEALLQFKFFK